MKKLLAKIRKILHDRRTRQMLTRIVSVTAAIVVFITTYALVLPAITMESEANCGIEAHQHDESCYEDQLICGEIESPGHHHSEACYEVSKALVCEEQEHQHDDSCFDESGNLTCDQPEHTHDDTCYKESRELTCDIPESDGHQHSSACYERVLTCGKEIHTHSTACYEQASDSAASASADFAAVATTELGSSGATVSASTEIETDSGESDAASSETSDAWAAEKNTEGNTEGGAASSVTTNVSATATTTAGSSSTAAAAANTATASTGNTAFDSAAAEDTYIPQLEPVIFEQLLTKDTDIYYYHAEEGQEAPESSADIADWKRVNDDTELTPADLLRVYLRYTIPAGTLNATNDIARYRLPSNLHLTDQQMETINTTVNGVANQYVSLDTLEITDTEKYNTYLGIEATEGTRTPSDDIDKYFKNHPDLEGQEYINAVVRAENVFDDTTGEYAGQDLVFTFSPYTVQKNQHEYDADGQPTKADQKVDGWLCFDLHMDQIDWSEPVITTIDDSVDSAEPAQGESVEKAEDSDSSDTTETIEKPSSETKEETSASSSDSDALNTNTLTEKKESSAEIIFASKDKALKIDEISTELHLVEVNAIETEKDTTPDEQDQTADDSTDSAKPEMTDAETADDTTSEGEADKNDSADEAAATAEDQPESKIEVNAETYPAVSFQDTITVQAGSLNTDNETSGQAIPAETAITVSVIAEEETFPLGTTMQLGTVEDMDTVASAVEGAVEGQTRGFHAVDISFHNVDGEEIEPLKPIKVSMTSEAIKQAVEDTFTVPVVVHVEDPVNSANPIDSTTPADPEDSKDLPANGTDVQEENLPDAAAQSNSTVGTSENTPIATVVNTNETPATDGSSESTETTDTLSFDAGVFSVYAIVYTVDFHYEVNGKKYEFSIPGGGFASFTDLIEVLGIIGDTNSEKNGDENGSAIAENAEENPVNEVVEENSDNPDTNTAFTLGDVEVSEATRKFVADVTSVEFSSPELVDVSKVETDTTVGQIKESRGLECEYSAELTGEQIAEINAQTVEAGDWALISVLPFTSEETLTVTMKDGETFTIQVTDAQIKKTVIDAKGDTWEITVTYGEDAQVPDGAELKVREILPEDEEYEQYYQQSLEKVGVVNTESEAGMAETDEDLENTEAKVSNDNYAHIFDIQIWSDDHEIQPVADVSVSIKILDAPKGDNTDLQVVHFGKDGLELMELAQNDEHNEKKTGETELSFVTDEFSVYAVVNDLNSWNLRNKLDGKSFVLVSSDALIDGTFPEPWGGTLDYSDYSDDKKIPQSLNSDMVPGNLRKVGDGDNWGSSLDSKAVFFDENGTVIGGEPALWTFEFTGQNTCKLKYGNQYVEVYEQDPGGWVSADYCKYNLRLSGNGTEFTVSESNGKIRLSRDGRSITNVLSNPYYGDSRRLFAMSANNTSASLFTLCNTTHEYEEFKATKVSAADLQENKQLVIYHKDADGNLYALADDGTYVPITESGESVYWRTLASGKNILWNMTIISSTSGYYDFTSVADPNIHISPSITDDKVMDTKYIGVTLDGRQNGTYTSTIKGWDDLQYSWVGIGKEGNVATHVPGTGDEFMFAEYSAFTAGTPQTVDTVDSSTLGIKIRMFDYSGDSFISYSGTSDPDNRLYGMRYAVNGDTSTENDYTADQTSDLVGRNLNGGLPVSSGDMSMLFAPGTNSYTVDGKSFTKTDKGLANHLFIDSVYEETGYFHYSSAENYAYYTGSNFNVYQQVASPTIDPRNDQNYFYHGHFMPYNDINMAVTHDSILYDQNGNPLNMTDPRTYEMVYGISGAPDFFTGMSMEADFVQLENGLDKNGNPVIFKFTGDDDMWVFIDGVRVLDLGGIHEALTGTINFATGEVNVNGDTSHDLYWFYQQAGKADSVKWKDGPDGHKIFADFSTHSFNMFYMERGAGASNLDLHFNLPVVKAGSLTVAKKLSEPVQSQYSDVRFAYRAYLADGTVLKNGVSQFAGITYEGTNNAVEMDSNGVFYLKPGEAATIQLSNKDISYYVEELGVDTELYSSVNILEDETGPTMIDTTSYDNYPLSSDYQGDSYKVAKSLTETIANRGRVTYENTPSSMNLNELHITKKVINSKGHEIFPDTSTTFEFKVFLEDTDGSMGPYMQGDYYLTKAGTNGTEYYDITASGLTYAGYIDDSNVFHAATDYVYYDAEVDSTGQKIPHTVTAGSTITVGEEDYELPVCGNSGQNGSIAKIPAGYTVVIKNLLAGTEFYVEERLESPRYYPTNYEYVGKEVVEGTADPGTLPTLNIQDPNNHPNDTADGMLKVNTDGKVIVTNRLLALDIDVEKVWENGPATVEAVITIEISRLHLVNSSSVGEEAIPTGQGNATNPDTEDAALEVTYSPSTIEGLPEPPSGYIWLVDDSYTKTVTLQNGEWSDCISVEKTDENGRDYYYFIKKVTETGVPEGTEAVIDTNLVYKDSGDKTLTVTNSLPVPKTIDIIVKKYAQSDLSKLDDDAALETLKGATFELIKYDSLNPLSKSDDWEKQTVADPKEGGTGIFSFTGLTEGYYILNEIIFPDGYVLVGSKPVFWVTKNAETNELEIKLLDTEYQVIDGNASDFVVINDKTLNIGNTPGAALPSTGGPGTRLFTILGSILILGAGVLLWRRRRLI